MVHFHLTLNTSLENPSIAIWVSISQDMAFERFSRVLKTSWSRILVYVQSGSLGPGNKIVKTRTETTNQRPPSTMARVTSSLAKWSQELIVIKFTSKHQKEMENLIVGFSFEI